MKSIESHEQSILTKGYTVIPDVLSRDQVSEICDRLMALFRRERVKALKTGDQNDCFWISKSLEAKGAIFRWVALREEILSTARRVLGQWIRLSNLNGYSKIPRSSAQALHTDCWESTPGTVLMLNAVYCLDDFTAENGAVRVVLGSPALRLSKSADHSALQPEAVPVIAKAGSVVLYDGAILHGSGANTTDSHRRALHICYNRWWVAAETNFSRTFPAWKRIVLSDFERSLYGFSSSRISRLIGRAWRHILAK